MAAGGDTISRKEKRKLERNEKKQRKNKQQRVHGGSASNERPQQQQQQRKPLAANNHQNTTRKRPSGSSGGGFQNKFHELVQETTGRSMRGDRDELSHEDAEIKALETKLGLKSSAGKHDGLKRLQREYAKDGLGEDFTEFLQRLDSISELVKERKGVAGSTAFKGKSKARRDAREEEEEEEDDSGEEEEEDEDMGEAGDWPSDMEMDEETRREMELLQQEDAAFLAGMDQLPTDESDVDSDEELDGFDSHEEEEEDDDEEEEADEEDDEVRRNTLHNAGEDVSEEVEVEEEEEEEDASEEAESEDVHEQEEAPELVQIEEDIYGRPVLKTNNGDKKPSAYLPPHLRRQLAAQQQPAEDVDAKSHLLPSTMDAQALRELTRRVNGQLNRISESNMESIALEMEKIYRECGRTIVNAVLLDKLRQMCVHERLVMAPLVKVGGALVAALYHAVGSEVGGFFMEKFILELVESVAKAKAASIEEEENEEDGRSSKEPANLVLLVAMLYNFGVVQCTVVYDLFRRFVDSFSPIEIELTHQLLKACGHQLRADDPDALKEMVAAVHAKVAASAAQADERVRFILDLIYDLKKPTKSNKHAPMHTMSASLDLTSLKKWLGRVKTRCGNANNALRVSLHEILHADKDGRWWIVGGTWVGYQQANATTTTTRKESETAVANDNRLLKLAEKQRMNTDVRKRIFVAIMGAADCLDAYERLLQLHLKEKQEREIVRVVLHCCGQEAKFNRYYLLLSSKLCEMDARYKFTYQLAFWDTFKQLETLTPRRLYNLAQLLAGMMISGAMSLSCLKVIDFTGVEDKTVLFLRLVLEKIMKLDDEMEMAQVFQRLLQTKKAMLTIDGLAVFMHQHMVSFKGEDDPKTRQLLKQRCKSVKSLLDALSKSAATTESMKDFM